MSRYQTTMCGQYSGLARKFHVNPESCNNPEYFEDFLRFMSCGDYIKGASVTHILIDRNNDTSEERIMGFVSLRASSLTQEEYSDERGKIIVGRAALEIFELAVDKDYERQGIGSDLVSIAIDKAAELRKDIGIERLVLCAAETAVGFYIKQEFSKAEDYYGIPRDLTNQTCVAMFKTLPEIDHG